MNTSKAPSGEGGAWSPRPLAFKVGALATDLVGQQWAKGSIMAFSVLSLNPSAIGFG